MVMVSGPVRNPVVEWNEELTLAQAIVTADYLGSRAPRNIFIHRGPEVIRVNPYRLLRGLDDLPMEPGDLIEIRR